MGHVTGGERHMGLAEDHVDWFLGALRKSLIDAFNHGYKHGREDKEDGPPVDDRVKTYTRVPGEGWTFTQEDISDKFCEAGP